MKKYTENHEWIELQGELAIIGVTEHAAEQLGDIVFVELPQVGADCVTSESIAVLESVKAASDIYAPCGGKVVAINDALADDPELVNREPEGQGWLFKVQFSDVAELNDLMDESAYQNFSQ